MDIIYFDQSPHFLLSSPSTSSEPFLLPNKVPTHKLCLYPLCVCVCVLLHLIRIACMSMIVVDG